MPGGGDNLELALRIRADIGQAAKALQNVERDLAGLGAAGRKAEAGTTRAARGAGRLRRATDRLGNKLRDVRGQINIFGFSAASLFGSLGAGIVSRAANAIVNFGASVVRAGTEMEAMDQRFRAATGSAAAAAAELEFVRAEIERLGLDALGAESGYSGLLAAMQGTALEGQATRDIFTAVAEAARVMGLSAAETGGVLTALEQIASKGTVSAEELRGQLGERLPGAFRIAARAMGVTTGELDGMLSAGELLADDFLPRFAAELRRTFGGEVDAAADSAVAQFTRLDNAIRGLKVAVAESGFLEFLAAGAEGATNLVNALFGAGVETPLAERQTSHEEAVAALDSAQQTARRASARSSAIQSNEKTEAETKALEALGDQPSIRELRAELGVALEKLGELPEPPASQVRPRPDPHREARFEFAADIARINNDIAILQARDDVVDRDRAVVHRDRLGVAGDDDIHDSTDDPPDASAADRYIEALERRVALEGEVSEVARVRYEIEHGALADATEAERERLLVLAGQIDATRDATEADAERKQALADLREEVRREAEEQEQRLEAARRIEDEIAELEKKTGLVDPLEVETAAVERWRDDMLEAIGELGAGHEDLAARVVAAAAARIAILEDEARQAGRQVDTASGTIAAGLRDYAAEGEDAMEALRDATQDAAQSMEDAFVEFATNGKLEVGSLVDAILADFARLAVRQHITGPLAQGFAGLFGGGGTASIQGATITRALSPGAPGHIHHAGGIAGAPGGVARHGLPPWLWAGAPRYHGGGVADLRPDEVPVIVQRGEGIFTPEQMRALGAASAPPPVRVEIVNRGTPQRAVSAEAARGPDMAELVVSIIADDIAQGGHVGRRVTELAGGNY